MKVQGKKIVTTTKTEIDIDMWFKKKKKSNVTCCNDLKKLNRIEDKWDRFQLFSIWWDYELFYVTWRSNLQTNQSIGWQSITSEETEGTMAMHHKSKDDIFFIFLFFLSFFFLWNNKEKTSVWVTVIKCFIIK